MATKTRTANIIQPQTKLGARVVDVLYLLEHTCFVVAQRWYLSKNLRDRKFGPLKFTEKKRKSRQKRIRHKIA